MDGTTDLSAPARPRPSRHRRRVPLRAHPTHPSTTDEAGASKSEPVTQGGGGGSAGRGPVDDDGFGRRPDRGGGDHTPLVIALAILGAGAVVMTARLLAGPARRRGSLRIR